MRLLDQSFALQGYMTVTRLVNSDTKLHLKTNNHPLLKQLKG
jgi:hypothetical protein